MAVNWGLQGQGFDAGDVLASFGQAQQQNLQRQALQQRVMQQQREQQVAQQAGGLAATGDFGGARNSALSAGAFDIAKHIDGLEDGHRAQIAKRAQTVGALAVGMKGIPQEQRAARLQALAPQLRQLGFHPQELAQVDLSDNGLDGYISFATSADDAIKAYAKSQEAYTLNDGDQRFVGGQMIAQNEKDAPKADWIFDSESGSWLQKPGTGGSPNGGTPAMPAMGGGGSLSGMAAITAMSESGNRDFTPNGNLVTSPAGAQGAMQTMPTTQGNPGFGIAPVRDGSVAEKNRVGRDYLNAMMSRYNDPAKAWAAYNAGPGRLDAAIRSGGENWLAEMPAETRAYVAKNVRQLGGGSGSGGQPGVINVRAPKARSENAPSGYRFNGDRLEAIPGGPADKPRGSSASGDTKTEAQFRKEFNGLQEVKDFKKTRTEFQALRSLALNPNATAQDDIAVIFSFMKALDPNSTVREGEFATAQNAGGVPENVRNAYTRAVNGERLNASQRKAMVRSAYQSYKARRDQYNTTAEEYRGYAKDSGVNADRVARTYTPDRAKGPGASKRISKTIILLDQ